MPSCSISFFCDVTMSRIRNLGNFICGCVAEKFEIAFPRRLTANVFYQIAADAVVMSPHGLELGSALGEQLCLALLTSICLVRHQLDALRCSICDDLLNQLARNRL